MTRFVLTSFRWEVAAGRWQWAFPSACARPHACKCSCPCSVGNTIDSAMGVWIKRFSELQNRCRVSQLYD